MSIIFKLKAHQNNNIRDLANRAFKLVYKYKPELIGLNHFHEYLFAVEHLLSVILDEGLKTNLYEQEIMPTIDRLFPRYFDKAAPIHIDQLLTLAQSREPMIRDAALSELGILIETSTGREHVKGRHFVSLIEYFLSNQGVGDEVVQFYIRRIFNLFTSNDYWELQKAWAQDPNTFQFGEEKGGGIEEVDLGPSPEQRAEIMDALLLRIQERLARKENPKDTPALKNLVVIFVKMANIFGQEEGKILKNSFIRFIMELTKNHLDSPSPNTMEQEVETVNSILSDLGGRVRNHKLIQDSKNRFLPTKTFQWKQHGSIAQFRWFGPSHGVGELGWFHHRNLGVYSDIFWSSSFSKRDGL